MKSKKSKKKIVARIILVILIVIIISMLTFYNFFGKTKYIKGDITITSSCILDMMPTTNDTIKDEDSEEDKKGYYILLINGIKRDDFLAKYEVLQININGEDIDLETIEYVHLNKALSIRISEGKCNLDKGNVIKILIKEKENNIKTNIRLYNTTEVVY